VELLPSPDFFEVEDILEVHVGFDYGCGGGFGIFGAVFVVSGGYHSV
jgi:hypothetical protein